MSIKRYNNIVRYAQGIKDQKQTKKASYKLEALQIRVLDLIFQGNNYLAALETSGTCTLSDNTIDKACVLIKLGLITGVVSELRTHVFLTERGLSIIKSYNSMKEIGVLSDFYVDVIS